MKKPQKLSVAIASFEFEGNSFSPKVCGADAFGVYAEGEAIWPLIDNKPLAVSGGVEVLRRAEALELTPLLVAHGGSGGTVASDFFTQTLEQLLHHLEHQGPFSGVYFALHGAMVSPGVDDAEGLLLKRARQIVGNETIIAVSLDLHANVTPAMVESADIIVGYQNYPHDDAYSTGQRTCQLLLDSLQGRLKPVMRLCRLNMLVPVPGSSTLDPCAPLAKVKAFARSLESEALPSTSYFTCQPWLDDDQAGNTALAISHADPELAERSARMIAERLWALRHEFELPLLTARDAIERLQQTAIKPVLLADTGDSVGAGACGDSSYLLAQLLEHVPTQRCLLSIVDPQAVQLAIQAGQGKTLELALGFTLDPRHGQPLHLHAEIVSLHDGDFTYGAGPSAGIRAEMGPCAVLAIGPSRVLVTSKGSYEYADEQWRAVGLYHEHFDVVVLKNGMNFRTLLIEGRSAFLVDTPGASSANLRSLSWQHRTGPFWPRQEMSDRPFRE